MKGSVQSTWKGGIVFGLFVFILTFGASSLAERFGLAETKKVNAFPSTHVEKIQDELKMPGLVSIAERLRKKGTENARARAIARHEDNALRGILASFEAKKYGNAEVLARGLLDELKDRMVGAARKEKKKLEETRTKTKILLGNVFRAQKKYQAEDAILSKVKSSPIQDIIVFMRAESLEQSARHSEAVKYYDQVMAMDTGLFHKAKVKRARALFRAGRWSEAEPALRFVNENYIQYPRRPASLLEHAETLEHLKKVEDAADAYQRVFFDYPFRKEGLKAREHLARLEKDAVLPSEIIPARDRFLRYRQLRVNKHWETAMTLFKELKNDHLSESGHSAFEHSIEFQMALVDFRRREFDDSLTRLKKLSLYYEAGHKAGLSRYLLYRYMASIYGLRGDHSSAGVLIDKMTKGMSPASRHKAKAEFWEKHGKYEKAFKAYSKIWTASDKKTWDYAWLLYKTGRLRAAYRLFRKRAENASGRNRAMHLYWAARTLERANLNEEAYATFASISRAYSSTYYGIQAKNRLTDLEQRTSVHGSIEAKTEGIVNAGEKALDAFDDAIKVNEWETPLEQDSDRNIPRRALWGDGQAEEYTSVSKCTPDSTDTYCDAVWGDKTEGVLFSPLDQKQSVVKETLVAPEKISELEEDSKLEYDFPSIADAKLPPVSVRFPKKIPKDARVKYPTSARMYWAGRTKEKFENFDEGKVPGPFPKNKNAYDNELDYVGGLSRASKEIGEIFPELKRAEWLLQTGLKDDARESIRFVAEEFYELRSFARPRRRPHQIDRLRWAYRIDNRRTKVRQFWGILDDSLKYPVPKKKGAARDKALRRQQEIYDRREELQTLIIDALKETGDYYFVRKLTLRAGGWRSESPHGPARAKWTQIYPRAFPELVLPHAQKNGMNPYLMWALMMVESSFNPDSLSTASAMGLFQVIPRTGLKTAIMFDDEEFGSHDLLNPDVAVEHGAFYLSSLIKKFHGQELLAIPGYNGGPHRIGDWLEMRGNMPLDEFIEEIPFDEARGYAKKVFRFMVLYLRIYEGIDTMYVGQNMRKSYKAMPNF